MVNVVCIKMRTLSLMFLGFLSLSLCSCSLGFNGFDSYSVTRDPEFQETIALTPRQKVDVLFMVDNSMLMQTLHDSLKNNASAFVSEFTSRNADFQFAVAVTDAYRKKYAPEGGFSTGFNQGIDQISGYRIINTITPEPAEKLAMNVTVGMNGSTDARGLESLEDVLADPLNSEILRSFSHLATVFVSNEDDFSNSSPVDTLLFQTVDSCIFDCYGEGLSQLYYEVIPGEFVPNFPYYNHTQNNPDPSTGVYLIPTSWYHHVVSQRAGVTQNLMRPYSFHFYGILDHFCRQTRDQLEGEGYVSFVGKRYMDLIEQSGGGVLASICGDGATEVTRLAQGILSENFRFKLPSYAKQIPFTVWVADSQIPESETNGWSFNPDKQELRLHGNVIPRLDQVVQVQFIVD